MNRSVSAGGTGAVGGLIGTITMSVLLIFARKAGLLGRFPPERITAKALDSVGLGDTDRRAQKTLAAVLHLGFGVTCGAGFGLARQRVRLPISPALQGLAFGAFIWLSSYRGWLPALELMPPPERDRPARPTVMVLAHLLYGATLGLVVAQQSDQTAPRQRVA